MSGETGSCRGYYSLPPEKKLDKIVVLTDGAAAGRSQIKHRIHKKNRSLLSAQCSNRSKKPNNQ